MSSTYGENLKLTIFGQSHGAAVGMTLDGIPAGKKVDFDELSRFLARRAPGTSETVSARREADIPRFLCGLVDGYTCGAPITAIIENTDCRSTDYGDFADTPRPGHADFPAQVKYGPFHDVAGGGHFSGRLTAPLCIAGGMCLQWLESLGIRVGAHIIQIGTHKAERFDPLDPAFDRIGRIFPTLKTEDAERFQSIIRDAHAHGDSVGGRIECAVTGLPVGLGEPIFGGVENRIAQIVYGIPAVKSIGFGLGEDFASRLGSESNDPFCIVDGKVKTVTNHCGGILGGLTDGMPLIFDVTIKPTPSIALPQRSVSLRCMEPRELTVGGRHDTCIVPRAVPAVEAAAAIAVYDLLLGEHKG